LPPELEALVLAHLDAEDLDVARRDTRQLPRGMRLALEQKIRECEAPGVCRATYRGLFERYYRRELDRDPLEKVDAKREVRAPEEGDRDGTTAAGDRGGDRGAEDTDMRNYDKCATACLTGTAAIENLVRAYMADYDADGRPTAAPWQELAGKILAFSQAATESVGGNSLNVVCRLTRHFYGPRHWRLIVSLQIFEPDRPSYMPSANARAQLRAFGSFMRRVLSQSSPLEPVSSSPVGLLCWPSPPSRSQPELGIAATPAAVDDAKPRGVTLSWAPDTPGSFRFDSPFEAHDASAHAIRVFSRIIAALSYAFAGRLWVDPTINHQVPSTQTRDTYVSPVPRQLALLRGAFPTLPIRVLYRVAASPTAGRVIASVGFGGPTRSWPAPTVPEMVRIAIAAGVTDVAAERIA
jgi:hypothetical protein